MLLIFFGIFVGFNDGRCWMANGRMPIAGTGCGVEDPGNTGNETAAWGSLRSVSWDRIQYHLYGNMPSAQIPTTRERMPMISPV